MPIERARPDKDESDTELAVLAALAMGATSLTVDRGPRRRAGGPRAGECRPAVDAGARPLGVRLLAADARVRRLRAPAPDGGPATLDLGGQVGDGVSLLPIGADAEGVTTHGLPTRSGTSRCSRVGRAGSRTSANAPWPRSCSGAADSSSSRPLLRSEHGHADGRRRRLPESPCPMTRAPSTTLPTSADAGPSCTSIPRTTRPAAPSRRASSATPTRRSTSAAPTSGASARRARPASAPSARSSACRSRCSPTRTTPSPTPTAAGSRSRTTARPTGASRADVPGRPGRPDRPRLAQGQARGPRRGGPRRARRAPDARPHDRREPRTCREASLVGGDERSLGRHSTPGSRTVATRAVALTTGRNTR